MEACGQVQAPWRVPGFAFHNTWWPMHHCATGLQYLWGKSASVLKFYLFFLLEAENQGKTLWPQNLPGKPDVSMKRLVCWKETFEVSWSPTEVGVFASPPLKGNALRIFITFWWGKKKEAIVELMKWWRFLPLPSPDCSHVCTSASLEVYHPHYQIFSAEQNL